MKSKKGMEMTLSMVIIGIILLIFLAVVIYIFTTQIGKENSIIGGLITGVNESSNDPKTGILPKLDVGSKSLIPIMPFLAFLRPKNKKKAERA